MRQGKSSQKDKKINYTYRISSFYLFFLTREKIVHDTIAVHLLILLVKKDIKLTFFIEISAKIILLKTLQDG